MTGQNDYQKEVPRETPREPERSDAVHIDLSKEKPKESQDSGTESRVDQKAWEEPGSFTTTRDAQGRTQTIEGWLSRREGERPDSEKSLQCELNEKQPAGFDSGHVIAYSLGGPSVSSHGRELAEANQVPMDSRINRSNVAGIEQHLRQELEDGKAIYCKAEVKWGDGEAGNERPESVTYHYYTADQAGGPKPHAIAEMTVEVDHRPSATVGQAVGEATGERAKDFFSPSERGAIGEH